MELILYLLDNEWSNMRTIIANSPYGELTLKNAKFKLLGRGWLEERKGNFNSRELCLTEIGKEAASALKIVRELINQ